MSGKISLDTAMAAVASWEASGDTPQWGLHQIAVALRDEVVRLREVVENLEADALNDLGLIQAMRYDKAMREE